MSIQATHEKSMSPPKARYCVKCREYFLVPCFMSDDGTDDMTVCNRHEPEKIALRYCRGCDDFVALDLFPKTARPGYACRKHFNIHGGGKRAYDKISEDPLKNNHRLQIKRFYSDSSKFKHQTLKMSKKEIQLEILKIDPSVTGNYAVMPIDVTIPTTLLNVVVVTLEQRKTLMKMFDKKNTPAYLQMVKEIQASY